MDPDYDPRALDANAFAGLLEELFGAEMTAQLSQCAHCGNSAAVGTLRAYVGLGIVLRCSVCGEMVVRIAARADGGYRVDASGAQSFGG